MSAAMSDYGATFFPGLELHDHTGKIHKCDLWNGRPVVNVDYIDEDKYVDEKDSEKIDVYISPWKLKSYLKSYNRISV